MLDEMPKNDINEQEIFPFETTLLPEFSKIKAEMELHETPEKRVQSLKEIKEKIKNERLLKQMDFNDDYLLAYLRARKYNVTKAVSQIKACMNLRRNSPQAFSNFRFENTVITMTKKIVTLLPWRCHDGCAVFLIELDNWNPDEFSILEVKRMIVIFLGQVVRYPMTQVNGIKAIFDVKSNPLFRQLKHATPQNLYLLAHGTQDCAAARYKAVHIVNDSVTAKLAWMIVKQFLSYKMRKRVFFHSSPEVLTHYFPRKVLPVQYGGTLENYDMTPWLQKMMQPTELEIMLGGQYPEGYTFPASEKIIG